MKELGIPFRVVGTGHTEESYPPDLSGGAIARYLAEKKSEAYSGDLGPRQLLLTADTVVWHRDRELGKPVNREEALEMLRLLSGDTHQVYTGVCLRSARSRTSFVAGTDVTFSGLEEAEMEYYVDRFRPFDKAGAYGIQEWIGHVAVEKIVGSYFNVMGLPVQRVYCELKRFMDLK
jgi:septum formation protein